MPNYLIFILSLVGHTNFCQMEALGSVSVSHNPTIPRYKIGTSPM